MSDSFEFSEENSLEENERSKIVTILSSILLQ